MIEQTVEPARRLVAGDLIQPYGGGVNLQIPVDDVWAMHTRVVREASAISLPLEDHWYRRDDVEIGVRQFVVMDPDGYLLRFSEELGHRPATGL